MPSPSIPLDALSDPAILFDQDGTVSAANGGARALASEDPVGLAAEELERRLALRPPGALAGAVRDALAGDSAGPRLCEIAPGGQVVGICLRASVVSENGAAPRVLSVLQIAAVDRDVTGEGRLRAELAESEEKYRTLVDLAPDAILIHQDGAIVFANPAAAALLRSQTPGDLLGRPILSIVDPAARGDVRRNIETDLMGEESPLATVDLVRADGATVTIQGRGSRVPFARRDAVMVVLRDVTTAKRAEAVLHTSLERLAFAQQAARSGFWDWERPPDGRLSWSPEFYDLFGFDRTAEPSMNLWLSRIHPDDRDAALARVVASIRERTWLANEYRIVLPSGGERWIGAYGDTTYDAAGGPARTAGICFDITDRKRAEAAARESEDRLRLAKACAGVGTWEYVPPGPGDEWGSFLLDDETDLDLSGVLDWRSVVHPDDHEAVRAGLDAATALGEPFELEFRYDVGGRTGWIHTIGGTATGGDGTPPRVLGVLMDITETKRIEEALRESGTHHAYLLALGDRLRDAAGMDDAIQGAIELLGRRLEAGGVSYGEVDANGRTVSVRAEWTDGTWRPSAATYDLDDLGGGDPVRDGGIRAIPDVDAPGVAGSAGFRAAGIRASLMVPLLRGGRTVAVLAVRNARPRDWTPGEVHLARETADRLWEALGRFRAEEALRRRERTLQGIFRAAPVGIGMASHRVITQANDQLCRMTGYAPEELLGQDARLLYHTDESYEHVGREKYAQILSGGVGAVETRWLRKDGAVRDILLSSSPLDLSRPYEDVVFNALDITRLRESERAIETYMDELERSNEELQRFAYMASHDLQEPLRSIISFSQLLERRYRGKLDADADEFIGFIVEGGNRMQRLIEDLLQLSRVETKAKPLAPTDAGEVVGDALRLMDAAIREAGATVEVGPMPTVMADAAQLAQVFTNLVGNALKYRRPGVPAQVRISAEREDGHWRFSVTDNGIGIEEQYFDRIFVIFQRLHTRDEYEGTGIGLAVVKRIVERHGGRIRVTSVPGEGATFSFTLPAA